MVYYYWSTMSNAYLYRCTTTNTTTATSYTITTTFRILRDTCSEYTHDICNTDVWVCFVVGTSIFLLFFVVQVLK